MTHPPLCSFFPKKTPLPIPTYKIENLPLSSFPEDIKFGSPLLRNACRDQGVRAKAPLLWSGYRICGSKPMACICRASDEMLGTFVPVLVYWVYSGICMALASTGKYRLHPGKEEGDKNLASKRQVLVGVLVHQAFHIALSLYFFKAIRKARGSAAATGDAVPPSLLALAGQLLTAMLVVDTWQYFLHRCMHANSFLYRYSHAKHHRLVVPYACGALYYHTPEGLLLNTVGGFVAVVASGMSPRAAVFFFSLVAVKNVDIHCGLWIPWHPLHVLFGNNGALYHDVHHQPHGGNYNFSQPFFVFWDRILGTHLPYVRAPSRREREEGGLELSAAVKD